MNLFMPAERVLYDRAYYLSDEAEKDYAFEVAEEHGVDVGEVLYSDELMKEVRDALDRDFEIDPHDISYTMMEPVRGEWKSDRIDLYTPQDCFGFSDPFGGRIEYSEKKPKVVVAVKPNPVELGHRASVAASSTVGDRARGAGIRQ